MGSEELVLIRINKLSIVQAHRLLTTLISKFKLNIDLLRQVIRWLLEMPKTTLWQPMDNEDQVIQDFLNRIPTQNVPKITNPTIVLAD